MLIVSKNQHSTHITIRNEYTIFPPTCIEDRPPYSG